MHGEIAERLEGVPVEVAGIQCVAVEEDDARAVRCGWHGGKKNADERDDVLKF